MTTESTITKEQVIHLANLAQLELTEDEVAKFAPQLSSILQYIDKVKEVEISSDIKRDFRKTNIFREDTNPHEAGQHREALLEAMPKVENDSLVVKKILNN
jgi:aspartyl-tRNA(Asn)/glutamyl-tRNA(Gln) amidotransferase subunit C